MTGRSGGRTGATLWCIAITGVLAWLGGVGTATVSAASWTIQKGASEAARHIDLRSVYCTAHTLCTAVGSSFPYGSGPTLPAAERWNGTAWTIQPTAAKPTNTVLNGVSCSSSVACMAVGVRSGIGDNSGDTYPVAERWNGTRWLTIPVPRPFVSDDASLYAVSCTSAEACTAVGSDDNVGAPLAERWNGSRWSVQPTPNPGGLAAGALLAVSCTSKTSCAAVGDYAEENACSAPLAETWNGRKWAVRPTAALPECNLLSNTTALESVSCVFRAMCMVVGQYDHGKPGQYDAQPYVSTLAERESAGRWSVEPTPKLSYAADPWGGGAFLVGVSCASSAVCVAVGQAGSSVRIVPVIERWSGIPWQAQTVPGHLTDGALLSISCTSATVCTAVGYNDSQGRGTDKALILRLS